jgi:hypothetical protein
VLAKTKRNDANKAIQNLSFWTDMAVMAAAAVSLVASLPQIVKNIRYFAQNIRRIRAIAKAPDGGKTTLLLAVKADRKALGIKTPKELRALKDELRALRSQKNKAIKTRRKLSETPQAKVQEAGAARAGETAAGQTGRTRAYSEALADKIKKFTDEVLTLQDTSKFDKAAALQESFVKEILNSNLIDAATKKSLSHYLNKFMLKPQAMSGLLTVHTTHYNNILGSIEGKPFMFYVSGYESTSIGLADLSARAFEPVLIPIGNAKNGVTFNEIIKTVQEMPSIGENPVFLSNMHGSCDIKPGLHLGVMSKSAYTSVNEFANAVKQAVKGKASRAYIFYEDCYGGAAFAEYKPVPGIELLTIGPVNGPNAMGWFQTNFIKNPYIMLQNRVVNNGFISAKYTLNGVKHYPLRQAVAASQKLTGSYRGISAARLRGELKALNNLLETPLYTKQGLSNEIAIRKAISELPESITCFGEGHHVYLSIRGSGAGLPGAAYDQYTMITIPDYIARYVSDVSLLPSVPLLH